MAKINKITLDGISYDLVDTESRSLITETEQNLREEIDTKQDTLVPGNNIKTINGLSLVGPGNIDLATLSGSSSADAAPIGSSLNFSTTEDEVVLGGSTLGGDSINITIPTATTEKAGMMSAEDKNKLSMTGAGTFTNNINIKMTTGYYNTNDVIVGVKYVKSQPTIFEEAISVKQAVKARERYKISGFGTPAIGLYVLTDTDNIVQDCRLSVNARDNKITIDIKTDGYLYVNSYQPIDGDGLIKVENINVSDIQAELNNTNEKIFGTEQEIITKNVTVTDDRLSQLMTVFDYPILKDEVVVSLTSTVPENHTYKIFFQTMDGSLLLYKDGLLYGNDYSVKIADGYIGLLFFTESGYDGTNDFTLTVTKPGEAGIVGDIRKLEEEIFGTEQEVITKKVTVTNDRLSCVMSASDYPILRKEAVISLKSATIDRSHRYKIFFSSPQTLYMEELWLENEYKIQLPEEYNEILLFTPTGVSGTHEFTITIKSNDFIKGLEKSVVELERKELYGKKIVCFGDSITEFCYYDKRYSDWIADVTGANVINVGIGGTQIRQRATPTSSPSNALEAYAGLDIVNLIKAVVNKDFTIQITCADWIKENTSDDNTATIERLASLDFNTVDAVTILAGVNDFKGGQELGETGSNSEGKTLGAINIIISMLLNAYPHIKLYWITPTVWYAENSLAERTDENWSDNYKNGEGITMPEFVDAIIKEVRNWHIPICDLYWSLGWNKANFKNYFLDTDGVHPYKGFDAIGKKIAAFLIANKTF